MSRYFTRNCLELHFPNDCSHVEVTDDGRYLHVKDDGRYLHVKDDGSIHLNTDIKVPALDACMRYVDNGNWVEIDAQRRPVLPSGSYIGADHW